MKIQNLPSQDFITFLQTTCSHAHHKINIDQPAPFFSTLHGPVAPMPCMHRKVPTVTMPIMQICTCRRSAAHQLLHHCVLQAPDLAPSMPHAQCLIIEMPDEPRQ